MVVVARVRHRVVALMAEHGTYQDLVDAVRAYLRFGATTASDRDQFARRFRDALGKIRGSGCSHCGREHSAHVGCDSDWTGVDKHGR